MYVKVVVYLPEKIEHSFVWFLRTGKMTTAGNYESVMDLKL